MRWNNSEGIDDKPHCIASKISIFVASPISVGKALSGFRDKALINLVINICFNWFVKWFNFLRDPIVVGSEVSLFEAILCGSAKQKIFI